MNHARDYNVAMIRILPLAAILIVGTAAFGQVPPGVPYVADQHPNPILTYVTNAEFKPASYTEAQRAGDIELFGISQEEGRRESIEVAGVPARPRKIKLLGRDVEIGFYPVVRQTFALEGGGKLVLHSFKFPRIDDLPTTRELAEQFLHEAAFEDKKKREETRFGLAPRPDPIDVRGYEGYFFENEDGDEFTVFWVEDGVAHTATSAVSDDDLFRIIEDLL
jgi:hypothetical protein